MLDPSRIRPQRLQRNAPRRGEGLKGKRGSLSQDSPRGGATDRGRRNNAVSKRDTLIKVIGRDVWIGIWAFVLAVIAVTRWERAGVDSKPQVGQIWWRFPKFVIGFLVASILTTLIVHAYTLGDYTKLVKPSLIVPITALRTWAFTFSFLSIGLTTRFREFTAAGSKPFLAFTAGVIVNVILGYILSVLVFGHYWASIVIH